MALTAAVLIAGCSAGTATARLASTAARQNTGSPTGAAPPACTSAQLTLSYRGGGASAGNDVGTIVFRDTSGQACTLTGTVAATGLNAAGRRDAASIKAAIAGPGLLSPYAAPVPDGALPPAGELVYGWLLLAEYRGG